MQPFNDYGQKSSTGPRDLRSVFDKGRCLLGFHPSLVFFGHFMMINRTTANPSSYQGIFRGR